jgi:hypothetical protein
MASLTGQSINTSYNGLLKTDGNTALPTGYNVATITDGEGNATGFKLGQEYIVIEPLNGGHIYDVGAENGFTFGPGGLTASGSWDFTSATVAGLPSSPSGLVPGTAANSMVSDPNLTTIPAQADSINNIAIGNDAQANGGGGFPRQNIAIGYQSRSNSENGLAVGNNAQAGTYGTSVGAGAFSFGLRGFAGGLSTSAGSFSTVAIGNYSNANHEGAVCIGGYGANSNGDFAIAIGREVQATTDGIALGRLANASATGSVALGQGVAASTANTVTIKKLQMLDYATLDFADDAAAATGGIPLGGVYHTSGALKIRIV